MIDLYNNKLKLSKTKNLDEGFIWNMYYHSFGYVIELKNDTEYVQYTAVIEFGLTNMAFVHDPKSTTLIVRIGPKDVQYYFLHRIDPYKPLECNYSYHHIKEILSQTEQSVIEELKKDSSITKFSKRGAYISEKHIGKKYYIMIVNDTNESLYFRITLTSVKNLTCKPNEVIEGTINPHDPPIIKVYDVASIENYPSIGYNYSHHFNEYKKPVIEIIWDLIGTNKKLQETMIKYIAYQKFNKSKLEKGIQFAKDVINENQDDINEMQKNLKNKDHQIALLNIKLQERKAQISDLEKRKVGLHK